IERLTLRVLLDDGELAQLHALERREPRRAIRTEAPAADRRVILGRTRILDLRIFGSAERAPHVLPPRRLARIDREGGAKRRHLALHIRLDACVAGIAIRLQPV